MYETIKEILRSVYGWLDTEAPAPDNTNLYVEQNPTYTADDVAAVLDTYLDRYDAQAPPDGWPGTSKEYARHRMFTEGVEYWEYNTAIALGMIVEPIVVQGRVAQNVNEWWDNQEKNLNYIGYTLLDDTVQGDAERELRWNEATSMRFGDDWAFAGLTLVYQILTREGLLKKWTPPGLFPPAEYLGGDVRKFYGSNAQKVLDNLLASYHGKPPVWDENWLPL
jgi:hypothetical protein